MAEPVFVESHHEGSGRFAVLEEDGRAAYLYLLRPDQSIETGALAYMTVKPVDGENWHAVAKLGKPPPLNKEFATVDAVIVGALPDEFRIAWSRNGDAAALFYRDNPISWVSAAAEHGYGYSKAVSRDSPFAKRWDDAVYRTVFGA